jgi:hypothetical protein
LGVNFVCAQAGDAINSTASKIFFIGFARHKRFLGSAGSAAGSLVQLGRTELLNI